jgi:DNA helicase-2/ATP-dependent DNA helicase PcrA
VGDDAQSIYAFRGADFRNFLNFERDWPEAKVVMLEENYRSTPLILEAANGVIGNNKLQRKKNLWTKNPGAGKIRVFAAENEYTEAEWIVKTAIQVMRNGQVPENIAVLYRTNAQSRPIEQALIAAGLPYRMFGGIRFYERKEIKDIVAGLRLAANPSDSVSSGRIEKNFTKGKSKILIAELPKMGSTSPAEIIDYFLASTDYLSHLKNNYRNAEERIENIRGLMKSAREFTAEGLAAFLEQATLAQSQDDPRGNRGVNLMSIHMSKGLEFETVFVAGVGEGTIPHHRALQNNGEMEEERRLMYVAITRAARNLNLSFANIPSRFLYEIPADLVEFVNSKTRINQPGMPDEEDMWLDYD